MVDFYGKFIGKYTVRPMDPDGSYGFICQLKFLPMVLPSPLTGIIVKFLSHRIHVWYIYLHLDNFLW